MPSATPAPLAHRLAGGQFDFIVADGNTFTRIGSRFGESPKVLARENGMQITDRIPAGAIIHIDNRHIVPVDGYDLIEVNLPQRMLFRLRAADARAARRWADFPRESDGHLPKRHRRNRRGEGSCGGQRD